MNDEFKELKARIKKLDEVLAIHGTGHIGFAQALSAVHRAERHGDRARDPSPELRTLLEKAEALGRNIAGAA